MEQALKIHKFHAKSLKQSEKRAIGFVESIEEVNIRDEIKEDISKKIVDSGKFKQALEDKEKSFSLVKLFSILNMSSIQNLFVSASENRAALLSLIKGVNKNNKEEDIKNLVDRIIVVHKIEIIKQIFSEQRLKSATAAIENFK